MRGILSNSLQVHRIR